jgi:hypothetical protein
MYWCDDLLIGHKEDVIFYLYSECWFYWALGIFSRTMPDIFKISDNCFYIQWHSDNNGKEAYCH